MGHRCSDEVDGRPLRAWVSARFLLFKGRFILAAARSGSLVDVGILFRSKSWPQIQYVACGPEVLPCVDTLEKEFGLICFPTLKKLNVHNFKN